MHKSKYEKKKVTKRNGALSLVQLTRQTNRIANKRIFSLYLFGTDNALLSSDSDKLS